jgi:hypothetical protein
MTELGHFCPDGPDDPVRQFGASTPQDLDYSGNSGTFSIAPAGADGIGPGGPGPSMARRTRAGIKVTALIEGRHPINRVFAAQFAAMAEARLRS